MQLAVYLGACLKKYLLHKVEGELWLKIEAIEYDITLKTSR